MGVPVCNVPQMPCPAGCLFFKRRKDIPCKSST